MTKANISLLVIFIFWCISFSSYAISKPVPFKNDEISSLLNKLIATDGHTSRVFSISANHQFTAKLEGTSKGNGTILIHNLLIRILDQHDDGVIYNTPLSIDTKDLTGNNIKEIIISGIVIFTGDKETDPIDRKSITYIFSLNCKTGLFEMIYKHGNYSPIISDRASKALVCKQ